MATQQEVTAPWVQYRPRFRPDIEGLRAFAVLVVVLFHAKVPGFEGGFIGVDVFFVLSGYLITWLLVHEAERERAIDLARFYARRARRLLPAMAVVLVVTLGVTALLYAPFEQRMLARTWAATALYVSNIHFASQTLDYHGASAETNPLLHTWSLSVEEQFYLVWPWLVLLGLGVARWQRHRSDAAPKRLLLLLGLTTLVSFVLSLYLTPREGGWAFYLSPTRAWQFGAGGLAVLIPVRWWSSGDHCPDRPSTLTTALGAAGMLGLCVATVTYDSQTPFPGVAALLPVLSTVILLRCGAPDYSVDRGLLDRLLSLQPFQFLGKLSYSWYLWHWPALVFAAALVDPLGPLERTIAVLISLGLAYVSYRFVEDPLRHHRVLSQTPRRSFAMAAAVTVGGVALAALWWNASIGWSADREQANLARVRTEVPIIYGDDCDRFGEAELVECVYGDSTARRTAVLIGDSHAGQWFPAVHDAAKDAGWRLVVFTLSACPMVDVPALYNRRLGRLYPECPQWRRSALDALRDTAPDVVFVSSYSRYDVPVPTWKAKTRSILSQISQYSRRTVLVVDTPYAGFNVPACLARAEWRPGTWLDPTCTPEGDADGRARAIAQARVASEMDRVEVLNLRDDVCEGETCEATQGRLIRYRDDGHLSREFASTFSDRFRTFLSEPPTDGLE